MSVTRPLDTHEQKLMNIVKATHQNLAIARKIRSTEYQRRSALLKSELEADFARKLEEGKERINLELNSEVVAHEASLDDALIAAYNAGISILRIARDGFGNRYPGGVQQLIVNLRNEGLVGSSEGYQNRDEEARPVVAFPKALDVDATINDAVTLSSTKFEYFPEGLVLVEADEEGNGEYRVPAVRVIMDSRDPYFKTISKNAREGTPHKHATYATLYEHPATGDLIAHESREEGDIIWDHPVARWVKDHPVEARDGFFVAIATDAR